MRKRYMESGKVSALSRLGMRSKGLTAKVYVNLTMHNIVVTITAPNGDVLVKKTAGSCDFSSTQRSTKYAAQATGLAVGTRLKELMRTGGGAQVWGLVVYTKGIAKLRDAVIRGLASAGFRIEGIFDITPVPHNGCRPPKRRRT
jgi:small subunit ribosomal protein S11